MYKKFNAFDKYLFILLSLSMALFYIYSAAVSPFSSQYHRGIYVLITYILGILLYPSKFKFGKSFDYALILMIILTCGYFMLNYEALMYRAGMETRTDGIISMIGILVGVEIARRVIGNVFVLIGLIFLVYGVWGIHFPEPFSHPGNSLAEMSTIIFLKDDGVFGIVANAIATFILLFVIFGSFLEKSGAHKFFIDFPLALVGHKTGGPAKVAIISSALFGSISGSAIANTVSTGAFTIPMMKKAGFRPHVAGGIEPAASVGGMFLPPIMGAGAFIMSEITGVPYVKIMLISIFPALMYFFSVFVMVHFEAKKMNIKGTKSEKSAMEILKKEGVYIIPLILITLFMVTGFSAALSAVIGIFSCILVSWFRRETRMTLSDIVDAVCMGAESSVKIGATLGIIGIIISVLSNSGFILTFTSIMIDFAKGSLFLTILLVALASLVLGMGVPGTVAYLVTAVVAVPVFTHMGVNLIAAHMIVYWLSQDSNITPPVCIAAFAGATIAEANMWKTALVAFKYAKFLYLGAFLFGYVPGFSMQGDAWDIVKAYLIITIGTFLFSYLLSGTWFRSRRRQDIEIVE
ncbi:TRAP transporter permease [Desulfospira joergensenii]|uniref:TRAP transporter permease n=1 Tax=Desulfospira joergensenii TaxID=53329 RepID=UPI0003B55E2F|nr:TRAP transporter fused permease subunit [Desulfospira joergensenii]